MTPGLPRFRGGSNTPSPHALPMTLRTSELTGAAGPSQVGWAGEGPGRRQQEAPCCAPPPASGFLAPLSPEWSRGGEGDPRAATATESPLSPWMSLRGFLAPPNLAMSLQRPLTSLTFREDGEQGELAPQGLRGPRLAWVSRHLSGRRVRPPCSPFPSAPDCPHARPSAFPAFSCWRPAQALTQPRRRAVLKGCSASS